MAERVVLHADVLEELVHVAVLTEGLRAGQLGPVVAEDTLTGRHEGELEITDLGDHLEGSIQVVQSDEEPGEEQYRDSRRRHHENSVLQHVDELKSNIYQLRLKI